MRWPWQKKVEPEPDCERPEWQRLPMDGQLAWLDSQPWSADAQQAWKDYWEALGHHKPITDALARLRFMAAWWRAREENNSMVQIDLPFIGHEGDWLHFSQAYPRKRFH